MCVRKGALFGYSLVHTCAGDGDCNKAVSASKWERWTESLEIDDVDSIFTYIKMKVLEERKKEDEGKAEGEGEGKIIFYSKQPFSK